MSSAIIFVISILVHYFISVEGGICARNRPRSVIHKEIGRWECCSSDHTRCWVEGDGNNLVADPLFFMTFLLSSVDCPPCELCGGQVCRNDENCEDGECVCKEGCTREEQDSGLVCSSDGYTYNSLCQLKQKNCRLRRNGTLLHQGPCGLPCQAMECPRGQHCVHFPGEEATCVSCHECNNRHHIHHRSGPVCGTDEVTYSSSCELRQAKCNSELHDLRVAYRGPCRSGITCSDVNCGREGRCIPDKWGMPICVPCSIGHCPRARGHEKVCGSDGVTYRSRCHFALSLCNGIEAQDVYVKSIGRCRPRSRYQVPATIDLLK